MGKTNNIFGIIIAGLIILVGILFLAMPIQEGFKSGKGKRGRTRRARGRTRRARGGGKRFIKYNIPFRRNIRKRGGGRFYRRSGYRRYPYYGYGLGYGLGYGYNRYRPYYGYGYNGYSKYRYPWYSWLSPFNWGSPYGYSLFYKNNWFDYRNCPSGCVANSFSPSGYTCRGDGTISSCVTDYDCSGCNNPIVPYY